MRLHGALTPEREHVLGREGCSVPGCVEKHRAKGFCIRHYGQRRWQEIKRTLALFTERQRA